MGYNVARHVTQAEGDEVAIDQTHRTSKRPPQRCWVFCCWVSVSLLVPEYDGPARDVLPVSGRAG